jgi:transmembrane sensor
LSGGVAVKPAHDSARPFEVVAGNTRVTALGTQFSVLRLSQDTEVVLVEGKVRVSADGGGSRELNAPGEFTRVTAEGIVTDPRQKFVERPELPLTPFQSATLSDVAAAFNRHNATLQIEVKGDRGTHYDLRLQLDNPEEWLAELGRMSDAFRIERRVDVITIVTITVLG